MALRVAFFLTVDQQTYLYTSWHVVTGVDWLNLGDNQVPNPPERRHYLAADVPAVEVQPPGVGLHSLQLLEQRHSLKPR